ncbi:MAG: 5-oxoprolinase subunit PxpB [Chitinophagaceae bacterium]|nr:5-oxoprolinase subunit PxpB [Chitinophagaceae bacterium]
MAPVLFPLGDSAITIDYGNIIDEAINDKVLARFHDLQKHPLPGMIEAIPAYSSLTIVYDLFKLRSLVKQGSIYAWFAEQVKDWLGQDLAIGKETFRSIRIPVCYDGPDLISVAEQKGISPEEVIRLHLEGRYRVYMLGFLPGFAYMGKLSPKLFMPRKKQPENMLAGSVAIAGDQTGIYPLNSPGGWWVIGRTDVQLFDASSYEPCLLRPGDRIEFYSSTQCSL